MKSVVVEGSTVAKAIELAWQKAEKPEEFFIRILQEHSNGFLGFGAQKAKVVLFFKNAQKSDSNFPTVLQQKEYANLFDNKNLKNPETLNVVDVQINKNVQTQLKKQHNQHKNNQHNVQQQNIKKVEHSKNDGSSQLKNQPKKEQANSFVQHKPKVNLPEQKQIVVEKKSEKNGHKQPVIHTEKVAEKGIQLPLNNKLENKDGQARHVVQALHKVKSQKIIAQVSKKSHDVLPIEKKVEDRKNDQVQSVQKASQASQPLRFKRRQLQVPEGDISGITSEYIQTQQPEVQDIQLGVKSLVSEHVSSTLVSDDLQNMVDKAADLVKNIQPMKDIVFARDSTTHPSFDDNVHDKKDL